MRVVPSGELSLPESVVVYFIAAKNCAVCRAPLAGNTMEQVGAWHSDDADDRVFVRPNDLSTNHWDIMLRHGGREPQFLPIRTNMLVGAVMDPRSTYSDPPKFEGNWMMFGTASVLGNATNSDWTFKAGFWAMEGLRGRHKKTGEQIQLSYETPFAAWEVRNAVHLPSDQVLFQLGHNQICIFEPKTRRVALLWHGWGPVAVVENGAVQPPKAPNETR
jgi:hypothetical protein